jgi:4-hydroxybenzoate polyprenyltransferase/phosphoserine phosphatase
MEVIVAQIPLADRTSSAPAASSLPLCVDLDETLVRSDTLVENLLALAANPRLPQILAALPLSGRAAFKQRVARAASLDPALLPYNEELLDWLRAQKAAGRMLVLVTATDVVLARAVAGYLGLFDKVIASDGTCNLKGEAKARALVARFGEMGFTYAGDSRADLVVWRVAGGGVLVNVSRRVASAVRRLTIVEAVINNRGSLAKAAMQAMRPHQWVKNILVFVPIFTAHVVGDLSAWISAASTFAAFCAIASSIYIVNDLTDLTADRQHPRKRLRPFARGAVPLHLGLALAGVLFSAGLTLAAMVGALAGIAIYAAVSVSYSFKLKEMPIVDVFVLAALYTIRLFAGGEVIGHRLSFWLFAFSNFLFLSLALVKRTGEMMAVTSRGESGSARRGYVPEDIPMLTMLGGCAAFSSSVVLALFVQSEATAKLYASPGVLWAIVPLVLFWQCRIWLITRRGGMCDDPIIYAARDWVSWLVAAASFTLLSIAKWSTFPSF